MFLPGLIYSLIQGRLENGNRVWLKFLAIGILKHHHICRVKSKELPVKGEQLTTAASIIELMNSMACCGGSPVAVNGLHSHSAQAVITGTT